MKRSRLEYVQNCYVVANLEAACSYFYELYGIGPFVGGSALSLENHYYRGEPAPPIQLRGVFVQSGQMNIELIELLSDAPSAFHDMFARGEEGFHHTAIFSQNYDADRDRFVRNGMPVASEFTTEFGAKICYLDARSKHGHMIELYPQNAIIRGMYEQAYDASREWSGGQLIIPWK